MQKPLRVTRPKNKAERTFYDWISREGYIATKRGWPDFFCIDKKTDSVIAVEVKPNKTKNMTRWQHRVMGYLSRAGIKCYSWNPKTRVLKEIKFKHGRFEVSLIAGEVGDRRFIKLGYIGTKKG